MFGNQSSHCAITDYFINLLLTYQILIHTYFSAFQSYILRYKIYRCLTIKDALNLLLYPPSSDIFFFKQCTKRIKVTSLSPCILTNWILKGQNALNHHRMVKKLVLDSKIILSVFVSQKHWVNPWLRGRKLYSTDHPVAKISQ